MLGCSSSENQNDDAETDQPVDTVITAINDTPLKLNPDTTFSEGNVSVGMFSFESLQPLFDQQDEQMHLINFWATWCKPCVAELPYFNQVAEKYPAIDMNFVSLDFSTNVSSKVIPFLKENELKGEVMVLNAPDANAWIPKIDPDWSGAIPATLIYKGDRREFYEQSFTFEELDKIIQTFEN